MRFLNRSSRITTLAASSRLRPEVCPPSLRCEPDTTWQRWLFWLLAPAPQDSAPPLNHLPQVRADFLGALADLRSGDADNLRLRMCEARSLRDLWHARAELFRLVGVAHGQSEAERRVGKLDCHFGSRSPRMLASAV